MAVALVILSGVVRPAAAQGLSCNPQPNGDGSFSCTITAQGFVQSFPSVGMPCIPDGVITVTQNEIFHLNFNNNGAWGTSTSAGNFTLQNGTFGFDAKGNITSFTPNGIVYTGHFAVWFGFSANKRNFVIHDILNVIGNATAPDGSTLTFSAHLVDHMSVSAAPSGGNLNMFFLANC